jgi:radical SAM-linked protein
MTTTSKFRLRFSKTGDLRFTSHHDLMRCFERMARRAALPLALSQGFTPRPKVVFASPLALGIAAQDEVVDVELTEPIDPTELLRRLADASPSGLEWREARLLPAGAAAPSPVAAEYRLELPADRVPEARSALASLLASAECRVIRRRPDRGRETIVDLRPLLEEAEVTDTGALRAVLKIGPGGSARPEELLGALGLRDLLDQGAVLVRTRLELTRD